MIFKQTLIATAVLSLLSATAYADDAGGFEQISIIGSAKDVSDIPGSGAYLDSDDIAEFEYTDIMRLLGSVPGVYVMEEDGYGLRPNIGMRGVSLNRSEKITIMEDGVLAAPAAYAAPSAYYFPTFGRMSAVEVLKGSSGVMYGPRTTGGVINLVSREISGEALAGNLDLSLGQDNYSKLHGFVGGSKDNMSGVLELFSYQADGFKTLPVNANTGFKKNDILAKFRVSLDEQQKHQLEFKFKYSDEDSNETYVGLTDEDFKKTPYQRYSASQLDNMDTQHNSYQINYEYEFADNSEFNLTAYHNDFHRNWYKVNKIGGEKLGSDAEDLASAFDLNPVGDMAVDVKANNRDYLSQGVQMQLITDVDDHHLTFGLRVHKDEMDRFQWVDKYDLHSDLSMSLQDNGAGIPGSDSNRVDSGSAVALYVYDEYTYNDLVVSGGFRYEDMTIERDEWKFDDENDLTRTTPARHVENSMTVVLPSVGLTYRINDDVLVLGGIQKGFAPAAPGNDSAEEEKSWNYEVGTRFNQGQFSGEVIGFYSDYSNMHGNCTASQGCDDVNLDNQYNAGAVEIKGVEVMFGYDAKVGSFDMPLSLAYTYSNSEFNNSFNSSFGVWGNVVVGDEIPYIPEQQLQLKMGLTGDKWDFSLSGRYLSEMRVTAGQGTIAPAEGIDSRTVWDLSAKYRVADNQQVYLSVDNLMDKLYTASRAHGGVQPGKYRTVQMGYTYKF
jgi:Fe(3+) dicitrate transport protein